MTNSTLLHRFFYGVPHHFIGRLVHIDRHRVNTPRESQRTHNLLIGRQSDEGGSGLNLAIARAVRPDWVQHKIAVAPISRAA